MCYWKISTNIVVFDVETVPDNSKLAILEQLELQIFEIFFLITSKI